MEPLVERAAAFRALGHPSRLLNFRPLVDAGPAGLNVGAIRSRIGLPASTLSHHLDALRQGGIVRSWRQERFVYHAVVPGAVEVLIDVLQGEGVWASAGSKPG